MNKLIDGYKGEKEKLAKSDVDKFDKADLLYKVPNKIEALISGSFKVPESEFEVVNNVTKILVNRNLSKIKQSEIFRMGIAALSTMSEDELFNLYSKLTKLKTGGKKNV